MSALYVFHGGNLDIDLSVVKTKFLFNSPQLATQDIKR